VNTLTTPALVAALADAALRGAVLLLLLGLAGWLWRFHRPRPEARTGGLLAAGLAVQVVASTPAFEAGVPLAWQAPWIAVSVANALLFWWFVQSLFDDRFRWRPWHAAAWLAAAGVSALNCTLALQGSAWLPWTGTVQRLVPLLGAGLAAWAALRQWRADLVESRRRLRAYVLLTGVGYTLVMLLVRLGMPQGRLAPWAAALDMALLLALLLGVAGLVLVLPRDRGATPSSPAAGPGEHPVPAASPDPHPAEVPGAPAAADPADPADPVLAAALAQAMDVQQAWRDEDLSVAGLASRLGVPEYRLRRHINQHLGHRNFNAYVNGLRLAEAQRLLADAGQRDTPVLRIALDAGFGSIGPFNRAFKAATGLTPTEFRRQTLAES
jgi:AraC-like DNA-binding protein